MQHNIMTTCLLSTLCLMSTFFGLWGVSSSHLPLELINEDSMPATITIQSGPFTEQVTLGKSGGRKVFQLAPTAEVTITGRGVGVKKITAQQLSPQAIISTVPFHTPERLRHLQITTTKQQG